MVKVKRTTPTVCKAGKQCKNEVPQFGKVELLFNYRFSWL